MAPDRPGDILTVEEMARHLRISRAKAYTLTGTGDIPTIRIGRSVRVRRDVLDQWIEAKSAS